MTTTPPPHAASPTGPATLTAEEVDRQVGAAFPGTLRLTCADLGPDFSLVRHEVNQERLRPGGFIAGPTQFAVADAALWYLTFGVLDRVELMALTQSIDIEFLRPAHGEVVWGRAELLSAGSRKVVGALRIWCDDREDAPCAVAKGTYVLPRS